MTDSLDVTIVSQVAAREGVDPTSLEPPLYDVVDVDALEQLVRPDSHERTAFEGRVSFEYRGYTVTVEHTGDVSVSPAEPSENRTERGERPTTDPSGSQTTRYVAPE